MRNSIWREAAAVQRSIARAQGLAARLERPGWVCSECNKQSARSIWRRKYATRSPADDPTFTSIVDNPPQLVRANKKHNWGLAVLAFIPITAFALGSWQVQRLGWKTDLLARFEDRLVRDPLPLPPSIDPESIKDFDYRRVYATGRFRHDQEMLIGPRMHDGIDGYLVVTPLERDFEDYPGNTKILVSRGWISKEKAEKKSRPESLPTGEVTVKGLLREPWKKNMFTPDNQPEKGKFFFPDVEQMAKLTGSQPVWIEETMIPDLVTAYNRQDAVYLYMVFFVTGNLDHALDGGEETVVVSFAQSQAK
ncbi:putative cytochrome oxidase assembly protein shy1 [Elsinoe australis]|uniref:SURF1-like protein n=1 Tax=Elsinoe australis TaxID=40998 RepID=A0A4U7B4S9_9PEZI|nr:putative cytochrome oxidase assembly protein shy1 [Elsinoe australis]